MGSCESCFKKTEEEDPNGNYELLGDPLIEPQQNKLWNLTETVQVRYSEMVRAEEEDDEERRKFEAREQELQEKRENLAAAVREQRSADQVCFHCKRL